MVVVDDLLMFPFRSVLWIFREIHHAAQEELATEADSITAELSNLYMRLETGKISKEEFVAEEKTLLEWLERIQKRGGGLEAENDGGKLPEQGEGGEELREQSVRRRAA